MAKEVVLPKQGNTVESCVILDWKKKEGDAVAVGDILCEVETDKAVFAVESPEAGTLLKILFPAGEDVPVLHVIAIVGAAGEAVSLPTPAPDAKAPTPAAAVADSAPKTAPAPVAPPPPAAAPATCAGISPRARKLAAAKGINAEPLTGTGPGGRIIERDVKSAIAAGPLATPAAIAQAKATGLGLPAQGSGIGGRVLAADLVQKKAAVDVRTLAFPGATSDIPVKSIRKLIAARMFQSLSTTAQLTLSSSANASSMLHLRERFKKSGPESGFAGITLNDFVLYAVARTLPNFRNLNAHFLGETIREFEAVHLGLAVDTPKGLMVPVIRHANSLSLHQLSAEAKRLSKACNDGTIQPDALSGGTFTITNLGALGVESFTPVLNAPEVGILGVCTLTQRPAADGKGVTPHMGLSLTFNHQAIDGAPAARFLKAVADALADIDLLLLAGA